MPLVTAQEISELLSIISSVDQTIQKTIDSFEASWPVDSSRRFRALCFLLTGIESGIFRPPVSRLNALAILQETCWGDNPATLPFLHFLLQASQDNSRPRAERYFIQQLVTGQLEKNVSAGLLLGSLQGSNSPILGAEKLWQLYQARVNQGKAHTAEANNSTPSQGSLGQSGIPPPWSHSLELSSKPHTGIIPWQHMQMPHVLRWHASVAHDQTILKELQGLLQQALHAPLLPVQQNQVCEELKAEQKLVLSLDLLPQAVPQLVEHNPVIAFEVLVRLIRLDKYSEYLPELVRMKVSVHSMEVINRLSTTASLPTHFVHLYISKCLQFCEAAEDDKTMQLRRVRLVCVFLQSLIKNKIIKVQDLSLEVQTFCIAFSRVREAAALYRMLKKLENGAPDNTSSNSFTH